MHFLLCTFKAANLPEAELWSTGIQRATDKSNNAEGLEATDMSEARPDQDTVVADAVLADAVVTNVHVECVVEFFNLDVPPGRGWRRIKAKSGDGW